MSEQNMPDIQYVNALDAASLAFQWVMEDLDNNKPISVSAKSQMIKASNMVKQAIDRIDELEISLLKETNK